MRNFFIFLFIIASLNFYQPVISPTLATIEPIVLENSAYLNHQNINSKKHIKNKEYWVIITGYSSSYDETDDSPYITASGIFVEDGLAASNFLPFGTKILIPDLFGNKIFTINDRMNERYSNVIDIWFPTKWEAFQFGKKYAKIIILSD